MLRCVSIISGDHNRTSAFAQLSAEIGITISYAAQERAAVEVDV